MNKRTIAALAAVLFCGSAAAQDNYSTTFIPIDQVVFYSNSEPIYPAWAGYAEVIFTQAIAWSKATSCSTAAVAIRAADVHLISAAELALASGRNVRVSVEDSQILSGVCILRALTVKS